MIHVVAGWLPCMPEETLQTLQFRRYSLHTPLHTSYLHSYLRASQTMKAQILQSLLQSQERVAKKLSRGIIVRLSHKWLRRQKSLQLGRVRERPEAAPLPSLRSLKPIMKLAGKPDGFVRCFYG